MFHRSQHCSLQAKATKSWRREQLEHFDTRWDCWGKQFIKQNCIYDDDISQVFLPYVTIKKIGKEEHTAVEEPQPSTSIEFEETGVVMDETPASETIVSVI